MYSQPVGDRRLVACLDCDLVQRLPELAPGDSARCPRCGTELWRTSRDSLDRSLALAIAAAPLYLAANAVPMLGLTAAGREQFVTMLGGAHHLWQSGMEPVAALVLLAAVIAPALQIGLLIAIGLGARAARAPSWVGTLLRFQPTARTWSMLEVMLVGVLVALIKISDYARVIPGTALYLVGALIVLLAAMQATFDRRQVWEKVEWVEARAREAAGLGVAGRPA